MVCESEAMISSYNLMIVSTEDFGCDGLDELRVCGRGGGGTEAWLLGFWECCDTWLCASLDPGVFATRSTGS